MIIFRKILPFLIYPVIVWGGGALIIFGTGSGISYWLVVPPALIAAAALVMFFERVLPYEKNYRQPPLAADLTHYFVNYGIKQAALTLYAQMVGSVGFLGFLWTGSQPFAVQVILALIIIDFFLYAVHRFSHENNFLWQFHALHHSSVQLYWLNGEKRHPLHQIMEGLPGITAVMVLGAPPAVIAAALGVLALNMMLQHGNIDYRAGFLRYLFSVAELHRWHHVRDAARSKVNFGAWLIVWDLVFGTYSHPAGSVSWNKNRNEIGIAEPHPQTYIAQLLHPFKNLNRQKAKEIKQ